MIMKRIFITLIVAALCLASFQTSAQQSASNPKSVNSKISEVTLFLDGAEIIRDASVEIPKGITTLKFESLSRNIVRNSVQFSSDKDLTILSVTQRNNFLAKSDKSSELEELEKRLNNLNEKVTSESSNLSVILEDMEFLRANRTITGQNATLSVTALQQMSDFYTKRFSALKAKEVSKSKAIKELTVKRDSLLRELEQIRRNEILPAGEVLVKVSSKESALFNLRLTYATGNASWNPIYDIRAESIEKPLILSYKGEVIQKTGENWKGVILRLSSGNPTLSGVLPALTPQYVRYPQVIALRGAKSMQDNMSLAYKALEAPESVEAPAVIDEKQTSTEFTTSNRYTINSDGERHSVDLATYEMPAQYKYYAVPKLDKDAFLVARVPEREKYNLLNGEASIYFEGRFVGSTFIDTNSPSDTLDFSLGRDKGISISREQIVDFTSKRFIGSKKEESTGWRTIVRNNKNQYITIVIADQIPISTDDEIEVSEQNLSGGVINSQTGEVKWDFSLAPATIKQIDLQYIIKYPKNKTIEK